MINLLKKNHYSCLWVKKILYLRKLRLCGTKIQGCTNKYNKRKKCSQYFSEKNSNELNRVATVDNRPSTDKIHNFVQKEKKKKMTHVTCDMWYVTCGIRHAICDSWHVIYDKWQMTTAAPGLLHIIVKIMVFKIHLIYGKH